MVDEDQWVARLCDICLGLPEATRDSPSPHATFRVRGRTFAYYLHDHHGDGIIGLACKAPDGKAEALVAADPERFYAPAYLAARGWLGVRLDSERVDWDEIADLLTEAYVLVAPKRLGASVRGA
jgi:predicted DNA-binding protein (MmcQ/YjbR family)